MTISAKVVADSIAPHGVRLITFETRYPKYIHGEAMTHRMFSRNASSSRAIPVERLIADVESDPVLPVHWGKNQSGMQARDSLIGEPLAEAIQTWDEALAEAIFFARRLAKAGVHKQIVNRIIEPFCHIRTLITATDYENFFALRRHEDAQPEIHQLADAMWEARAASTPRPLAYGEWHTPYFEIDNDMRMRFMPNELRMLSIRCSVARCARVSYMTHEGQPPTIDKDMATYHRLMETEPLHASPAEHQATPDDAYHVSESGDLEWAKPHKHGNLRGWIQYRKTLPREYVPG